MFYDTLPHTVSPTTIFQNPLCTISMLEAVNIIVVYKNTFHVYNPIKAKSNAKSNSSVSITTLKVNIWRPRAKVINQCTQIRTLTPNFWNYTFQWILLLTVPHLKAEHINKLQSSTNLNLIFAWCNIISYTQSSTIFYLHLLQNTERHIKLSKPNFSTTEVESKVNLNRN